MSQLNLGVLVSGGGTNLQAIIDACEAGRIDATVTVVISDKADAYALERASSHDIPAYHVPVGKNDSTEFAAADRRYEGMAKPFPKSLTTWALSY